MENWIKKLVYKCSWFKDGKLHEAYFVTKEEAEEYKDFMKSKNPSKHYGVSKYSWQMAIEP